MTLSVKVDVFEGPLDLLLQLIKKAKVDIYDIPIAEITNQYMEYLKAMEELDLEIASEFLLMAATLIEIKSKMLLPKRREENEEIAADEDPRKELVDKLVEYKKYKEFALQLKEYENFGQTFFKQPEVIDDIESTETLFKNITLGNIMKAFKRVIEDYDEKMNKKAAIPEDIDQDEYKIEDKMDEIQNKILINKKMKFQSFFEYAHSKIEIIVTFLAMLELMKLRLIRVIQYENYSDIIIEGRDEIWRTS